MDNHKSYLIGNYTLEPPIPLPWVEDIQEPGIFALLTKDKSGYSPPRFIGETSNLGTVLTLRDLSLFWRTVLY